MRRFRFEIVSPEGKRLEIFAEGVCPNHAALLAMLNGSYPDDYLMGDWAEVPSVRS